MNSTDREEKPPQKVVTFGTAWKRRVLALGRHREMPPRWQTVAEKLRSRREPPGRPRARAMEAYVRAESERAARPAVDELSEASGPDWPAATPEGELPPTIARSPHFSLDAQLRESLSHLLDRPLPPVTVYTGQAADRLARRYGADALTYGDKVLFRSGAYQPEQPAGRALLGHELTHAAQFRRGLSRSGSDRKWEAQEREALGHEAQLLARQGVRRPGPTSAMAENGRGARNTRSLAKPSVETAVQPQAAQSGRTLPQPAAGPAVEQPPSLSEQQLRQIKEAVYQDLVARLRIEFERGG